MQKSGDGKGEIYYWGSIVNEFYIPLLKESILYKRAVGFFSSSSLASISEGLECFIDNFGKIQIVTSPRLQEEDIEDIKKGYRLRNEILKECLFREMREPEDEKEKENLNLKEEILDLFFLLKDC